MSEMEVYTVNEIYTVDEIIKAIQILETVQDGLETESSDVLYDMLQEVIDVLYCGGDEE